MAFQERRRTRTTNIPLLAEVRTFVRTSSTNICSYFHETGSATWAGLKHRDLSRAMTIGRSHRSRCQPLDRDTDVSSIVDGSNICSNFHETRSATRGVTWAGLEHRVLSRAMTIGRSHRSPWFEMATKNCQCYGRCSPLGRDHTGVSSIVDGSNICSNSKFEQTFELLGRAHAVAVASVRTNARSRGSNKVRARGANKPRPRHHRSCRRSSPLNVRVRSLWRPFEQMFELEVRTNVRTCRKWQRPGEAVAPRVRNTTLSRPSVRTLSDHRRPFASSASARARSSSVSTPWGGG